MAAIHDTARYDLVPADQYSCSVIETIELVYHRPSGITHLLLPPMPQILAVLRTGERTVGGIVAALEARFDLAVDGEESTVRVVAARLDELRDMGLVVRR